MMNTKLVILDRDGTINEDRDDYVKSPEEWHPLPQALEAIARLNHAGWHVAVASNQSGLGRGLFDVATLNAMHAKMNKLLAAVGGRVDAVFFCPHSPDEPVVVANLCRACLSKLVSAMASTCKGCPVWAILCVTSRLGMRWAAPPIWC